MKAWLIVGGILGAIVVAGVVIGSILINRAVDTPYVDGKLDKSRLELGRMLTAACVQDKKGTAALCDCIGDKAPRYLPDGDAAAILRSNENEKAYKEATARFAQAAVRAGFVCGMDETRRKPKAK